MMLPRNTELQWAVHSFGTVLYAVQYGSNFWGCGWNPNIYMTIQMKSSWIKENLLPDNDAAKMLLKESCFMFFRIIYYPLLFSWLNYLFKINQYLSRNIQFSRASLNGALTQTKQRLKHFKRLDN